MLIAIDRSVTTIHICWHEVPKEKIEVIMAHGTLRHIQSLGNPNTIKNVNAYYWVGIESISKY